jgi:hypothetical protein
VGRVRDAGLGFVRGRGSACKDSKRHAVMPPLPSVSPPPPWLATYTKPLSSPSPPSPSPVPSFPADWADRHRADHCRKPLFRNSDVAEAVLLRILISHSDPSSFHISSLLSRGRHFAVMVRIGVDEVTWQHFHHVEPISRLKCASNACPSWT